MTGRARFGHLLPRGNLAGSLYGLILVTSVIATLERTRSSGLMIAAGS